MKLNCYNYSICDEQDVNNLPKKYTFILVILNYSSENNSTTIITLMETFNSGD